MITACIRNRTTGTCLWCGVIAKPAHVDPETRVVYCVDCCQLCEAKRSKRNRVKPLVMGGKAVQSLSGLPEVRFNPRECVNAVDLDSAMPIAMTVFDPDEQAFIRCSCIIGLTVEQLTQELGWTVAKARRVQRRVNRMIAQAPLSAEPLPMLAQASGVTYLETLPSGHQAWGMTRPNPGEQALMGRERRYRSKTFL